MDSKDKEIGQQESELRVVNASSLKQREKVIKAQVAEIEELRAGLEQAKVAAAALQKSNLRMSEKSGTHIRTHVAPTNHHHTVTPSVL